MRRNATLLMFAALALAGCSDNGQSVLTSAGVEARQINRLTAMLFALGCFAFLVVLAAIAGAIHGSASTRRALASRRTVVGLGLVFPVVTLLALFIYSVRFTGSLLILDGDPRQPVIKVTGEQWWWRVNYTENAGTVFETANEVHVPVGQPVVFELASADVIHSFWVPALGGKIDMIPGRTTRLRLTAERPGIYRGQCAEYCGGPHALMAFTVVALEPQAYAVWLDQQKRPAPSETRDEERKGAALFKAAGCGACHAIDGTSAAGTIGPNLTHVGSRRSVGTDQNVLSHENIVRFLSNGQTLKPQNHMPEFGFLQPHERGAIASYLLSLK